MTEAIIQAEPGGTVELTEAEIEARLEEIEPRLTEAKANVRAANLAHHEANLAWQSAVARQQLHQREADRVRPGVVVVAGHEQEARRKHAQAKASVAAAKPHTDDALEVLYAEKTEARRLRTIVRALSKRRDYLKHIALSDARKRAEKRRGVTERRSGATAARLSGVFNLIRPGR